MNILYSGKSKEIRHYISVKATATTTYYDFTILSGKSDPFDYDTIVEWLKKKRHLTYGTMYPASGLSSGGVKIIGIYALNSYIYYCMEDGNSTYVRKTLCVIVDNIENKKRKVKYKFE